MAAKDAKERTKSFYIMPSQARQRLIALVGSFIYVLVPIISSAQGHTKVRVEFIRSGEASAFLVSNLSLDQLPDTFELDTILDIGSDRWVVNDAQPAKKVDFGRTGKLKLFVSKLQLMSADDLLFSTPSISDDIAKTVPGPLNKSAAVYHEDAWRQIEFISTSHEAAILQEIEDIEEIYRTQKKGNGFANVHVRKRVPFPLRDRSLTIESLRSNFDIVSEFSNATLSNYGGSGGTIVGGFAFRTEEGWIFWGQATDDGSILYLCLDPENVDKKSASFTAVIENYLDANEILLVDWVRGIIVGPRHDRF